MEKKYSPALRPVFSQRFSFPQSSSPVPITLMQDLRCSSCLSKHIFVTFGYFISFPRSVTVDTARHRCTEGLFKPSVWGKDNPGIHELTVKAIMACSIDIRKQMCRNIYLSGGGSMSKG